MLLIAALTLSLADFRHLISINDAQISGDGSRVVYVEGVPDFSDDRYHDFLRVVPARGGSPRTIAVGHTAIASPRWSPSGTSIAYLTRGRGGKNQIFVVNGNGGRPREITFAANDVEQFAWSPNGAQFAFVTQDAPANPQAASRGENLFDVHDDGYLTSSRPSSSHIWVVGGQGGRARRVTSGSWSVLETAPPFVGATSDPSWSRDGRSIVFTRQADADDSDSDLTTVVSVDVANGLLRKLGSHPKYEYQPVYSPDDRAIAYLSPHGPGPISVLNAFVTRGSSETDVTAGLDADVLQAAFVPGSDALLLLAPRGISNALLVQPLAGGTTASALELGVLSPSSFSISRNGMVAFIASRTDLPPEVYVSSLRGGTPRRLTYANGYFEPFAFGTTAEVAWNAPDGERSDGLLTYPVNFVAGRKYPLVLRIHGGPEASTTIGFDLLRQIWASRGYLVFQPNYRGSDNLGSAHEHAIFRDPGNGPGNDVLAGIASIEALNVVDSAHIAVTGHSYGGFMTTWLLGHANIWKAGVVGDGMVDWRQEYDDSAAGNLAWTRDSLGGTPMDASSADLYATGSPISYASAITAPTLIISGTADETVPATESYELYHALYDRGVPVRFVAIPEAHHFPNRPAQIEGYFRATIDWVEHYLWH